ncbi:heparan-alpha-glucosaminide N-acetyltransferase domain-containing protein [Demequina sp.]|uniref:heparan-alpha-glucosaminide N-acetyltransferase domain-containing protein n=1 Tax=Demequina sp. TaxID=2050685 RepID=UPI003A841966
MTDFAVAQRVARIDGLDVARAVAILGMVGAHIGDEGTRSDADGWGWLAISHGLPSSLFAVLAGVSMTLMLTSRGTVALRDVTRDHARATRVKIAVRGALLIPLGLVLTSLETYVAVILTSLGVMFLMAAPLIRVRSSVLLSVAGVLVIAGGWAARELGEFAMSAGDLYATPILDTLWSYCYPAPVWMAYILVGIVIGRLPLRADATAGWLTVAGLATACVVRGGAWLATGGQHEYDLWLSWAPHGYTPVEMTQNIGVAAFVIGVCLWVTRRARTALWPLRTAGSMALTLYTLHLIVIAVVGNEIITEPSNVAYVALSVSLVAFACVWRHFLGQGPLERVLTVASNAAAQRAVPSAQAARA